ncbi:MAG: 4-alpha-glucanotransferase [Dehalococcoidia bacterium]
MNISQDYSLHQLATLYGVQTDYCDMASRRQEASVDALLAVLRSLGAPITTPEDAPVALRARQQALWQQLLEPVVVAWEGQQTSVEVRLPPHLADGPLFGHLTLETGEQQSWKWHTAELPVLEVAEVEGTRYVVSSIPLPEELPWGYHRFTLEVPGKNAEALIVSAPIRAYNSLGGSEGRAWGVFLPLYSLHTKRSWGSGDFSDLETLTDWVAEMGGSVVATLPLLAAFLDEPTEPSPYTPMSRLLWNEFYVDITAIPELQRCPSAQAILESSSFQEEIESQRNSALVDYRHQMSLKRRVLEELCRCCLADAPDRLESLRRFARAHPVVEDYASFRATCEKRHALWTSWPQRLREGTLQKGDYDDETKYYHLYAQWLAHQQFQTVSDTVRKRNLRLYLDLPLGVHPDGYDVWRNQSLFIREASGGAPPDEFFSRGQNWGFPPLHPEKLRQQSYNYYIECLRHQLKHAGILRIDHVMSLHRLFWIPKGMEACQGLYVSYSAEELYAILALESHRYSTVIVGENLGTVPPEVSPSMAKHGLNRMYVVQYELTPDHQRALSRITDDMVASLNTHDMLPFAAFLQGLDIEDRIRLGLLDETSASIEQANRQTLKEALVSFLHRNNWAEKSSMEQQAILRAALRFLGASSASFVLVNLEDLWLETEAQNMPGTTNEFPNWRRRARHAFETFCQLPQVVDVLQELDRIRKHPSAL